MQTQSITLREHSGETIEANAGRRTECLARAQPRTSLDTSVGVAYEVAPRHCYEEVEYLEKGNKGEGSYAMDGYPGH